MIGYVRGIVTHLFKESCYVDVHGVGYRVYVPTTTRQQLIEGDVYKRQIIKNIDQLKRIKPMYSLLRTGMVV